MRSHSGLFFHSAGLCSNSICLTATDSQVWRTSFGLGLLPLLFMLYYRIFRLRESAVWRASRSSANQVSRGAEFSAMCYHFWHRCGLHFNLGATAAYESEEHQNHKDALHARALYCRSGHVGNVSDNDADARIN